MRLKLTPLLLISVGLFLYSLYLLFFSERDIQGYWMSEWMVITGLAVGLTITYFIFRALFKSKVLTQAVIEAVLIGAAIFYYYKTEGEFLFSLPKNYKGHVLVIYNVQGQPELPTNFFTNKVKVTVPATGIILTSSSPLNKKYYHGGTFMKNGTNINNIQSVERRHDLPLDKDTINCNGKKYLINKWIIKEQPNWTKKDDTLYRLSEKLQLACDLIKNTASANNSFEKVGLTN